VSRDNPAGDAANPTDAALLRLRDEPIGIKDDRFRTLRPRFADARNWKRVRFFGHPTRAAFRYGDDGYAVAVILYSEAADDEPRACLDATIARAARIGKTFDVALGPVRREMREYPRGIEALDLTDLERETDAEYIRQTELFEQRRSRIAEARERALARGGLRLHPGRLVEASRRTPSPGPPSSGVAPPVTPPTPEEQQARDEAMRRLDERRERVRRDHAEQVARNRLLREAGHATIPVALTSGRFHTLVNDDRYLAAVVAYPSWPGTCLVQGFAVKVGSDEVLAEDVIERWVSDQAPQLEWRVQLTEQPPIENR
jgi:hypothetical protein